MPNEEQWLAELRQVYERDKAQRLTQEQRPAIHEPEKVADQLLRRCRAYELMRKVQKTLLDGGGTLQFYKGVGGYNQAIVLMWKGPISAASKPANIKDVSASIIVGANEQGVFVNDSKLTEVSAEALRERLLDLARRFVADKER